MLGAQWDSIATSFIETLKFIYEGLPNNDHTLKGVAIDFASQNAKRLAEHGMRKSAQGEGRHCF